MPLSKESEQQLKAYYEFLIVCYDHQNQLQASNLTLSEVIDYSNQHLLEEIFNQPAIINAPKYEVNVTVQNSLLALMPVYYETEAVQFA